MKHGEKRRDWDLKESGMIVLFGCNRVSVTQKLSLTATCLVVVSMVFVCLFSAGCRKRANSVMSSAQAPVGGQETVITNRMNDPNYVTDLKKNIRQQLDTASAAHAALFKMNDYKKQVKDALPPGIDDAALERILSKDEVWLKLKAASDQALKEDSQTVAAARARIRQAMIEESRAREAVAEGRAKAGDRPEKK